MRRATGRTAGPDKPPVLFAKIIFLRRTSTAMPVSVLIMETASAPALSAASAISEISVTFGESFTISGFLQCARTAFVMSSTPAQLVPNCTPPCFTFGQEMFISIMSMSVSFSFSAMAQ